MKLLGTGGKVTDWGTVRKVIDMNTQAFLNLRSEKEV